MKHCFFAFKEKLTNLHIISNPHNVCSAQKVRQTIPRYALIKLLPNNAGHSTYIPQN